MWGWHGPLFALALQVLLMWWALSLLWATRPALPRNWCRVRIWEAPLYRRLGVYAYRNLLRAVGWEHFRREAPGFDGRRASLARFEQATREAEYTHALLILLNLLALYTAWLGQRDTALWPLLSGVFLHLYPVTLQRTMRSRLSRLPS